MSYSVFREPPIGFHPTVEAAGCYCYCGDKLLFLRRHPDKYEGNTWGTPGGKLEGSEDPRAAVIREIREEVGLDINDNALENLGPLYYRIPEFDFILHIFKRPFKSIPPVTLALTEHLEYKWVTRHEAFSLTLMTGGKEALAFASPYIP